MRKMHTPNEPPPRMRVSVSLNSRGVVTIEESDDVTLQLEKRGLRVAVTLTKSEARGLAALILDASD